MRIDASLDQLCRDMDFSDAKPVSEIPALKARQAKKALELENDSKLLDEDITHWLLKQNGETKRHFNEMVRHALAMQGISFA